MKQLLATLLLLPLLLGANAGTVAPIEQDSTRVDAITTTSALFTQPALPGITASTGLLEIGTTTSWRTSARPPRTESDPSLQLATACNSRARSDSLLLGYLAYGRTLDRAHANVPTTFSNPPPAPLT